MPLRTLCAAWLAALLVAGPGIARAADWRIVIADPAVVVMVDADTFKRDGDMRSFAWRGFGARRAGVVAQRLAG